MTPASDPGTVRFEDFELDARRGVLSQGGVPLKLQPQPFRLLQILLDRAPEVVSREELAKRIWGGEVHVDLEQGINFCVRQVRAVLDDSASDPRFIDTLPKQGYRFIGAIVRDQPSALEAGASPANGELVESPAPPSPDFLRSRISRRNVMLMGGGAAVIAAGGAWLSRPLFRRAREGAINVVLSLPEGTAAIDQGLILGSPALAPDGSAVILALNTPEGSYLYMRRLESDRLARMEGTHNATQPFWSPDSLHVGFFADAKIKRMPVAGGSAVALCEAPGPRGGAWGRGGSIIFGLNFHGIYQVSEDGGRSVEVTHLDASKGENSHRTPVFLADGVRFLYFARAYDPEHRAIYVDSLKTSDGRRRITVADGNFTLGRDPVDDACYLLCQQAAKITVQPFDMRQGTLMGTARVLLNRTGTLSASDTGVLVIRTDPETSTRLRWFDRSGHALSTVGDSDDYWSVALAPNGESLLAIRHNSLTGEFHVWTASVSQGLLEPITDSGHAGAAFWSNDSRAVYYTDIRSQQLMKSTLSSKGPPAFVMDLHGKDSVLVEAISPDGKFVVGELITEGDASDTVWSEVKASPVWQSVGASGYLGQHASLTADGRWLAFASSETGRSEIYLMSFPGGERRQRISVGGGQTPRWRRDGGELFFVASDGTVMAAAMSLQGDPRVSPPVKLFQAPFRTGSNRQKYDVSGDGQRFLVICGEAAAKQSEIEMVINWPSL